MIALFWWQGRRRRGAQIVRGDKTAFRRQGWWGWIWTIRAFVHGQKAISGGWSPAGIYNKESMSYKQLISIFNDFQLVPILLHTNMRWKLFKKTKIIYDGLLVFEIFNQTIELSSSSNRYKSWISRIVVTNISHFWAIEKEEKI